MTNDQFRGTRLCRGPLAFRDIAALHSPESASADRSHLRERSVFAALSFSRRSKRDWLERWEFWNSALSRHQIDTGAASRSSCRLPATARNWSGSSMQATPFTATSRPTTTIPCSRLARAFPDARFIVIWRDLFDTCRSIVRASKGSSTSSPSAASLTARSSAIAA